MSKNISNKQKTLILIKKNWKTEEKKKQETGNASQPNILEVVWLGASSSHEENRSEALQSR